MNKYKYTSMIGLIGIFGNLIILNIYREDFIIFIITTLVCFSLFIYGLVGVKNEE